jgi:prevent-host-death family protein
MLALQTIGTYEAKTHLADLLRQVRAGQGFTITQRGDPVADLIPAGTSAHRAGSQAAKRMRQFVLDAPKMGAVDIRALLDEGRD